MEKHGRISWVALAGSFIALFALGWSAMSWAADRIIDVDQRALANYKENKAAIIDLLKENAAQHMQMMGDLREIKALIKLR